MDNGLPFGYNLLLKSVGVVGLDSLDGCMHIVVVKPVIFAVRARTTFALFPSGEAIAIHLKAATLLALAGDLVGVRSLALAHLRC